MLDQLIAKTDQIKDLLKMDNEISYFITNTFIRMLREQAGSCENFVEQIVNDMTRQIQEELLKYRENKGPQPERKEQIITWIKDLMQVNKYVELDLPDDSFLKLRFIYWETTDVGIRGETVISRHDQYGEEINTTPTYLMEEYDDAISSLIEEFRGCMLLPTGEDDE